MRRLLPLALVLAAGCNLTSPFSQNASTFTVVPEHPYAGPSILTKGKIKHVVIIVQENRSPDNLFQGLKGADILSYGYNSAGQKVNLTPVSFKAPYDLDHEHRAYAIESDNGAMNAFNLEHSSTCIAKKGCPKALDIAAYGYVPSSETGPYLEMARQYVFADKMFQTNEGPSFPAHLYLIAGTSEVSSTSTLRSSENPYTPKQTFTGGCDSPAGTLGLLIDTNGQEIQETYPCYDRQTLMDLISAKGLTWRYYEWRKGPGLWNAPDAIKHLQEGSQFSSEVVTPPSRVLTDISNGNLADVVWVTPTAKASDHATITNGSGPSWVASVVNAVGKSSYWDSTVVFVTWDDWGGWDDHVSPPVYNSYELGFRVPAIVISAYSKKGYVSHVQHEFGSILKFTEQAFSLGSLGTTDARADNFSDAFDFNHKPRPFVPIKAPLDGQYFLRQGPGTGSPDND